ncbi:MAG: BamA/TamA family outer membrane protein [bacterium]|nr:BamA/TamA family outer membrane protein [bacterium]
MNSTCNGSPPIRVDGIQIIGNDKTHSEILLREIYFKQKQWLDSSDLIDIENRLTNLNLFHRVEVFPLVRMDSIYLVIAVTEKWYIFPLPYFHWVGPEPNDFEYGFRYLQMNFQGLNRTLIGNYYHGKRNGQMFLFHDPWIIHSPGIGFLFLLRNEHWYEKPPLEIQEEKHLQQTAYLGLSKRFGYNHLLKFGFSFQKWDLDTTKTVSKEKQDYLHSFRVEYERDHRDLIELPHTGDYFSQSFEWIRIHKVWKNRFVGTFDYRQYLPLHQKWTLSCQLLSSSVSGEDPTYLQLRLGHTHYLRGYRNLDRPGVFLVKGVFDLRYQTIQRRYYTFTNVPSSVAKHFRNLKFGLSTSLFYEMGQSWKKGKSLDSEKLLSGYGISLIFTLPYVNILRFDVGFNPRVGIDQPALFTELKTAL